MQTRPFQWVVVVMALLGSLCVRASWAADEEFVGPFSTWTNVKTTYGAVGTGGATDDTAEIQAGLTALAAGTIHTLYIPAGTYNVSSMLTLTGAIYARIIGEHPSTTILKWTGSTGAPLLRLNGVRYSSVNRLTFDGSSVLNQGLIEQRWDCLGGLFDTGNEYVDNVFKNATTGIHGGQAGCGFAETTVKRNIFQNLTYAGIALWNANALDLYVWDSTFENCKAGIQNIDGAGDFRVYRSLFKNSTSADLWIYNTGVFSFRDNVSIGSNMFFEAGSQLNPNPTVLQGNRIVDSISNNTVHMVNQGPLVLYDNIIRGKSGATAPLVSGGVSSTGDTVSIGNTYTVASAVTGSGGRLLTHGDTVVDRTTVDASEPTMPGPAVSMGRTVYEVTAGSSAATIQTAIGNAVTTGNKAIVHLQAGAYTLSTTLTIPANADIQIVGDGYGKTDMQWSGGTVGPMWQITGPTKVIFQNLTIRGSAPGWGDGIVMQSIDQAGARIHLAQLEVRNGSSTHVRVQGVNRARVELRDWGSSFMGSGTTLTVDGGRSRTVIYSGASSDNPLMYRVLNGGTLLVRDMWYESSAYPGYATLDGYGMLTIEGSRINTVVGQATPAMAVTNGAGRVLSLANNLDDRIVVSGDGTLTDVLGLGMLGMTNPYLVNTASPAGTAQLIASRRTDATEGSVTVTNPGTIDTTAILNHLALTRSERPGLLTETAAGVSDIRLQRVWVQYARHGITILGTPDEAAVTVRPLVR